MNIYQPAFSAVNCTPYTYFIKHKATGKMYYGRRTAIGCKPEDLWITYFTSSKVIKQIIKDEGTAAFSVKIAKIFDNVQECIRHEEKFLTRMDAANNPRWFNKHNGGISFSHRGRKLSEEHKRHISEVMTGRKLSDSHKKNLSKMQTGRTRSPEVRAMYSELRRQITSETRAKMAAAKLGTHRSEETKEKIRKSGKGRVSGMKGKTHSPETRAKMSQVHTKRRLDVEWRNV